MLSQGYPNLEFIVVDGGSTDGTLDILKKYSASLTWTSEPDRGQVDAINKGLLKASGDVIAYLNSDDIYTPNTLFTVGKHFVDHPDTLILTGKCSNMDLRGNEIRSIITLYKNLWLKIGRDANLTVLNYVSQPSTFWRRTLLNSVGLFDPDCRYAMDYDYWLRATHKHKLGFIDQSLAKFRVYSTSITSSNSKAQFDEELRVAARYANPFQLWLHKIHSKLAYWVYVTTLNRK